MMATFNIHHASQPQHISWKFKIESICFEHLVQLSLLLLIHLSIFKNGCSHLPTCVVNCWYIFQKGKYIQIGIKTALNRGCYLNKSCSTHKHNGTQKIMLGSRRDNELKTSQETKAGRYCHIENVPLTK